MTDTLDDVVGRIMAEADLHLPDAFWSSRPELCHIRQAAWSRRVSPDAVLATSLSRVSAATPHTLGLPATIGTTVCLSSLRVIVGTSGEGKTSGMSVAELLLPDLDYVDQVPSGSGEGIAERFFGEVTTYDEKGKPVKERRQTKHNLSVYIDEGQRMLRQAQQPSSTFFATLRSIFTGGMIGENNASKDRHRIVSARSYNVGLVVAFQPEIIGPLFDDLSAGTPGRFTYHLGTDPSIPDVAPPWPGELDGLERAWSGLRLPTTHPDGEEVFAIGAEHEHLVYLDPAVTEEIVAAHLRRARGQDTADGWSAHRNLVRLKDAALLMFLAGRRRMTADDWRLAGMIGDVSDNVRRMAQAVIEAVAEQREAATSARLARRAVQADEMTEQRRIIRCAEAIFEKVRRHPGELTRGNVRAAMGTAQRAIFEPAFDYAERIGWIEVRSEPGQGADKSRVWPGERKP